MLNDLNIRPDPFLFILETDKATVKYPWADLSCNFTRDHFRDSNNRVFSVAGVVQLLEGVQGGLEHLEDRWL